MVTFQHFIQRCLGGQVCKLLLTCLDDVIVYPPNFESHLQHLEQVLERLGAHDIKLQLHKSKLFQNKVTYNDHISNDGVSTNPEKTAVVCKWPVLSTVKKVYSF